MIPIHAYTHTNTSIYIRQGVLRDRLSSKE